MISACGNDCSACPRFTAQDRARLVEVAALWHRLGWRDRVLAPEEIACRGCTAATPCRYGIAVCAEVHGAPTCGACAEAEGCARLEHALERTADFAARARGLVDEETYTVLERAFFRKRENLA
jgi:hypothetical protein